MFGCVSYHFVTVCQKLCKTGPTSAINASVCATESTFMFFRNERIQYSLLDPKLMFGCVSDHFVTVCQKLCKTGPTCAFNAPFCVAETTFEFFATNASNPLHWTQKVMFGCVLDHFVTVHTVVQNGSHICY